jgi:hypothetical protein
VAEFVFASFNDVITLIVFENNVLKRKFGPNTALGSTQPPIQWVPGVLSLGVKRPGREADHSPPSIVEVKNAWSYTSTPNTSS